jgi:hypothetical protein
LPRIKAPGVGIEPKEVIDAPDRKGRQEILMGGIAIDVDFVLVGKETFKRGEVTDAIILR